MYSVLSVLRLSLFSLNHSAILPTSVFKSLQSSVRSSAEHVTLVSSAYMFAILFSRHCSKSFQFFVGRGAPSGLPKARGLGPWPAGPLLKPPLDVRRRRRRIKNMFPYRKSCSHYICQDGDATGTRRRR